MTPTSRSRPARRRTDKPVVTVPVVQLVALRPGQAADVLVGVMVGTRAHGAWRAGVPTSRVLGVPLDPAHDRRIVRDRRTWWTAVCRTATARLEQLDPDHTHHTDHTATPIREEAPE